MCSGPITEDDLGDRVLLFDLMRLPGQPQAMHMGTSYLVADLWREVQRLRQGGGTCRNREWDE